jgi:hypothetical protein
MHRARMRRSGQTTPRRGSRGDWAERYERFVVRASGCWSWSGSVNNGGYGRLGRRYAHRVSYELHHGPIAEGLFVLHRCDNPPCTNPDHLFLGTSKENSEDASSKGRLSGRRLVGPKLSAEQASEIRRLRDAGVSRRELSERYGIHVDNVGRIANGQMWRSA